MQGYPYTWANKQYVDAFMSGVQEPWVFQGGVQTEIQRLMPLDGAADLLVPLWPSTPFADMCEIRPYTKEDEAKVYEVCQKVYEEQSSDQLVSEHPQLVADRQVGGFLTLSQDYSFVIEFQGEVCGYVTAALEAKEFNKSIQNDWIPVMQQKYSRPGNIDGLTPEQEMMASFYSDEPVLPEKLTPFPSVLQMRLLPAALQDVGITKRALATVIAALKSNGSHGIHVEVPSGDTSTVEFYTKLGFFGLQVDDGEQTKVLVRSI
jgi:protein O-GlcNAcase/histone acetyltransferase